MNKYHFLFFIIHLYRYREAKILAKFRDIIWKKEHYQKKLIFAFFSDSYVQKLKLHAKPHL